MPAVWARRPEQVLERLQHVTVSMSAGVRAPGVLYITSYRLLFVATPPGQRDPAGDTRAYTPGSRRTTPRSGRRATVTGVVGHRRAATSSSTASSQSSQSWRSAVDHGNARSVTPPRRSTLPDLAGTTPPRRTPRMPPTPPRRSAAVEALLVGAAGLGGSLSPSSGSEQASGGAGGPKQMVQIPLAFVAAVRHYASTHTLEVLCKVGRATGPCAAAQYPTDHAC